MLWCHATCVGVHSDRWVGFDGRRRQMTFGSLSRYRFRYQHSRGSDNDANVGSTSSRVVEADVSKNQEKAVITSNNNEDDDISININHPINLLCFNCRTEHHYGRLLESRATLIVCPEAILPQWEREVAINVRPGTLRVRVYKGLRYSYEVLRRAEAEKKEVASTLDPVQLADSDVVRAEGTKDVFDVHFVSSNDILRDLLVTILV